MVSVGILSWGTVGCVLIELEYYTSFKTHMNRQSLKRKFKSSLFFDE